MKKILNVFTLLFIITTIAFTQNEPPVETPKTTNEVATAENPSISEEVSETPTQKESYNLKEQSDEIGKPIKVSEKTGPKSKADLLKAHGIARAEAAKAKQEFRRKRANREIKTSELSMGLAEDRILKAKEQIEKAKLKGTMTDEEIQIQEERIRLIEEKMSKLQNSVRNGKEKLQERQQ